NPDGLLASEPVAKWFAQKRFDQYHINPEEIRRLIEPGRLLPYRVFLTRLFDLYGKTHGKPVIGSLTPSYLRLLPVVHRLWPMAKFVHLIRDGRDVWQSVLSRKETECSVTRYATWAEDPVATTALWWKRKVLQGRQGGCKLAPGLYYEVRYES